MSNEVVEFVKELWDEIKTLYSEIKGLIIMANKHSKEVRSKAERNLIRIIKNRKTVKSLLVNKPLDKKPLINKQEIIVRHKGESNWFTNLLLLYLCLFNTLVVLGVVSYLVVINDELPVDTLVFYLNRVVDFLEECDEIDCADRLIDWIESDFPLVPDLPSGCGRIINGTIVILEDCSEW